MRFFESVRPGGLGVASGSVSFPESESTTLACFAARARGGIVNIGKVVVVVVQVVLHEQSRRVAPREPAPKPNYNSCIQIPDERLIWMPVVYLHRSLNSYARTEKNSGKCCMARNGTHSGYTV